MNFIDPNTPAENPDVPVDPSAAELKHRRRLGIGNIEYLHAHQKPAYDADRVVRHRQCPYCLFYNRHLISVCPRCNNCMACGMFNERQHLGVCMWCGNHNPTRVSARNIIANHN